MEVEKEWMTPYERVVGIVLAPSTEEIARQKVEAEISLKYKPDKVTWDVQKYFHPGFWEEAIMVIATLWKIVPPKDAHKYTKVEYLETK